MKKIQVLGVITLLVLVSGVFIYATSGEQKDKQFKVGTAQYFPSNRVFFKKVFEKE